MPILWDKKEDTIVNNESSEIMRMFNRSAHTSPNLDFLGTKSQNMMNRGWGVMCSPCYNQV